MTTNLPPTVKAKIDETIKAEGGAKVTNDPADRGGLTKYGVTQATWNAFREPSWPASVADATNEQAVEIYAKRYWLAPGFDRIATVSPPLAFEMFDWGVTSGPSRPVQALQRVLNALNTQAKDYPDISADGVYGAMSHSALTAFRNRRAAEGLRYLLDMVQSLRRVFYIEISERDKTQERFQNGWQSRIK